MKRSLACFLLLLVIAVGGSAAVFSQIFQSGIRWKLRRKLFSEIRPLPRG